MLFPKDQWEINQRSAVTNSKHMKTIWHVVGHGSSFQDREHLPILQETLRKAEESYRVWLKTGMTSAFLFWGP